jgi:hypothetical protein
MATIRDDAKRKFVRVLCRANPDDEDYYSLVFDCELDPKTSDRIRKGTSPVGFQGSITSDEYWAFEMTKDGTLEFVEEGWPSVPTTFFKMPYLRVGERFTTFEEGEEWAYVIQSIQPLPRDPKQIERIMPRH